MKHMGIWFITTVAVCLTCSFTATAQNHVIIVEDVFNRKISDKGMTLIDWEGFIANPAIKHFVKPPANSVYPVTVTLSANGPRLYFNLPSTVGSAGPNKTTTFTSAAEADTTGFYLSIFPDRDTEDENYQFLIEVTDANGVKTSEAINIHVIDQDRELPLDFNVTVDFSHDSLGFYNNQLAKDIFLQAADDWFYFFADMELDSVAADEDVFWLWNMGGPPSGGSRFMNAQGFKGFLLFTYGWHHDGLTSGGGANGEAPQTSNGVELPLKRTGDVGIEIQGNFNTAGWVFSSGADDDPWFSNGTGEDPTDFYSIAHHEMGHAIVFSSHPGFQRFADQGFIDDPEVVDYHGSIPMVQNVHHIYPEVDRVSKVGVFGSEYEGIMPRKQWLITKFDILAAKASGYKLRETSAFVPLSIENQLLIEGTKDTTYTDTLKVKGGTPLYNWTITSGELPEGLSLDSFTGIISGTPTDAGTFDLVFKVEDNAEDAVEFSTMLIINPMVTSIQQFDTKISSEFTLGQNYPNPFNPLTKIEFDLPSAGFASLKIYNALGEEINALVSDRLQAGKYSVQMDAKGLASGVYFYRLRLGTYVETKKMLLVR